MNTNTFQGTIKNILIAATKRGASSVRVNSGEVHREVGGYPGTNHRMPMCCDAMYSFQRSGDRVISTPLKGKGASLTIEYMLPR